MIEVVGRVKRRFVITCTCIVAISGAVNICVGRERKVRQRSFGGFSVIRPKVRLFSKNIREKGSR